MRAPPQVQRFGDGRLHLQDGPIDLIIEAFGAEVGESEQARLAALHQRARGLAQRGKGDAAGAQADMAQALRIEPEIAKDFERYGLR